MDGNRNISCPAFTQVVPLRMNRKSYVYGSTTRENSTLCVSNRTRTIALLLADVAHAKSAVLSIDVGTSGTKAALCFLNQTGHGPVSRVKHETKFLGSLQSTQCLNDWTRGAISTSRDALASEPGVNIAAISITGMVLHPV